ncbi:MAG TPA: prephenate dehydratase [Flavobacteriaceae bacterium]|nr:prephenate dehydratase [Flavobacteriaceae bacterium]
MKIAIQGIQHSFHHQAVKQLFENQSYELLCCDSFDATTQAVAKGLAEFGVLAIENSIAGSILTNYNLLESGSFEIYDEVYLNIQMHLMALPNTRIEDIVEVRSHPVALLQCRDYLRQYHGQFRLVEGKDTASEAEQIMNDQLKGIAAIASRDVAEAFGLEILDSQIQDIKQNQTRFVLFGHPGISSQKTPNKASIKFQLGHEVGSLSRALGVLSDYQINLTKIQSLPVLGMNWRYAFFVDVTFDSPEKFKTAIEVLQQGVKHFKLLGLYAQNKENIPSQLGEKLKI